MYRPTVRYSDVYRTYVDEMFHATSLDRNQIIRCALFTAAHNPLFLALMSTYKKSDVPLPSPLWTHSDHALWLDQDTKTEKERRTHDVNRRKEQTSSLIKVHGASNSSRTLSETNAETTNTTPLGSSRKLLPTGGKHRCEREEKRQQRPVSPLRLSNGGIKIDLR